MSATPSNIRQMSLEPPSHQIRFTHDGQTTTYVTTAATAGEFLSEHGINVGASDYLSVDQTLQLPQEASIEYRSAYPVSIRTENEAHAVLTTARTVQEVLAQAGLKPTSNTFVEPALSATPTIGQTITFLHRRTWTTTKKREIAAGTTTRFDPALAPGTSQIFSPGRRGVRLITYEVTRIGNDSPTRRLVSNRIVQPASPRVVLQGIDEYKAFDMAREITGDFGAHAATATIRMIATAYIAHCTGCTGITKIGLRAGHGIVAVDPHIIPLGSQLFIPGYGQAIAGDIGSAINGMRIDLGFNSLADALLFGRREITVFLLNRKE
ncbi:MAG TPA: ubiquitin-like domain-containing protein [Candidatus Baltobacteraceae bacterium]|jgi:3D (Asp-Asp-Asp) domain-containing protein|nr:ubiquitin-like domain-containing protein [Candidatus Baltobacteraceae bacterium]